MMILWYPYIGTGDLLQNVTYIVFHALLRQLASSGPYGPLLARSGYPGQEASLYNNPIVMIVMLLTILYEFWQICATRNALM